MVTGMIDMLAYECHADSCNGILVQLYDWINSLPFPPELAFAGFYMVIVYMVVHNEDHVNSAEGEEYPRGKREDV